MTDMTVSNGNGQQLTRVNEGAAMIDAILAAARDPSMDVEKMERLFAMHERMQDRQAAQAYAAAMTAAQAEMRPIVKDGFNEQTSSEYAKLEAIDEAIRPIYTRNGFSLSFGTKPSTLEAHICVVCEVTHADGHSKSFEYDNPMDATGIAGKTNKTPTHARGSAVTYARRYLTLMIFNLSTERKHDDDGNAATDMPDSDAVLNDWIITINECGTKQELDERRLEMIEKLGGGNINKVPMKVRNAAVERYKVLL